jgi:hypothetical protein
LSYTCVGQDSLLYRHQFGINAGEFIPLFRTQSSNFDLNYYFQVKKNHALRTGLNYEQVKDEDGKLTLGYRLGYHYVFKSIEKFHFYTGLDFNHNYQIHKSDNRSNNNIGASVFLGIKYQPKPYLSISTEPGFYWFNATSRDPSNFSKKYKNWNELKINNLGQLLISFHF